MSTQRGNKINNEKAEKHERNTGRKTEERSIETHKENKNEKSAMETLGVESCKRGKNGRTIDKMKRY